MNPETSTFLPKVGVSDRDHLKCLKIYTSHLSSFESIIRSEVAKYYRTVGLRSLVIITMLRKYPAHGHFDRQVILKILFRITDELMNFDDNTLYLAKEPQYWGHILLIYHYRHLFTGPRKSVDLFLDGDKYAQTALRILESLCADPPPIQYRKLLLERRTLNRDSGRVGAFTRSTHHSPSRKDRSKHPTDSSFLRTRREEKNRHGALSKYWVRKRTQDRLWCEVSKFGLEILPEILEHSSKLPELVDFIRSHSKDIAILPNGTRKAVRAMYEFLDGPDEQAGQVPLRWPTSNSQQIYNMLCYWRTLKQSYPLHTPQPLIVRPPILMPLLWS